MRARILVVDDEPLRRLSLQVELGEHGYEVFEAADALHAQRILDAKPIDVLISDTRVRGPGGVEMLTHARRVRPNVAVILMAASPTVDDAVQAIKRGAYDFLGKPFSTPDLVARLERLLATHVPTTDDGAPRATQRVSRFLACSAAMQRALEQARSAAQSRSPLLLSGERGVGKTLLAESLHEASPRGTGPLARVACGGAPPGALEAELFGLERGTTGDNGSTHPLRARTGKIEQAAGGTLVLDDVDAAPLPAQERLLRFVELGEYERVGGNSALRADVRIISTTSADLAALARGGAFREDLRIRLSALHVAIPALRERPDDVAALAAHLLERHARLLNRPAPAISPAVLEELLRYEWPGNVRELENVVQKALALCAGGELRSEHVLPLGRSDAGQAALQGIQASDYGHLGLNELVSDMEKRLILTALRQCEGNQAKAAQRLGIPRTTLRDKMAKYGIPA